MRKIYITVDVECHNISRKNQYIDGEKNGNFYGLKHILDVGKELNVPINFFVDVVEYYRYGEEHVNSIINLIKEYNQPVFLHLHPHYVSNDNTREFLWQYSYEDKREILKSGFDLFEKITGKKSDFFRIGCYGADSEMYKAMDEIGVKTIDLSYCYNNPNMCHITYDELGTMNISVEYGKQIIFPNTRFVALDIFGKQKIINLDATETNYNEYKYVIDNTKLDKLTLTMHSWNFIKKYFFLKKYVALDKVADKKFKKMIDYGKKNNFVFSELSINDFSNMKQDETKDELINTCLGRRKIKMLANNFVRFKRIGRISKKYFFLYLTFFLTLFLLISTLAIIMILLWS